MIFTAGASPRPTLSTNTELSEKFRSLPEGAVERSETEGVKQVTSNYKELPQPFFLRKNASPLGDGAEALIEFDIKLGQPCGCPSI